jgi:hypothetical protein
VQRAAPGRSEARWLCRPQATQLRISVNEPRENRVGAIGPLLWQRLAVKGFLSWQGGRRGSAIATITIARKLAEAIWWILTRNQPFAPAGAKMSLTARRSFSDFDWSGSGSANLVTHETKGAIEE